MPYTHINAIACTHTKTDTRCDKRSTAPLPDAGFFLCLLQLVLTKWLEKIKQCVIAFISQWLEDSDDGFV